MAEFEYKANDQEGRSVSGRVEADSVEHAVAKLSEQGHSVRAEDVMLIVGSDEDEETLDAILVVDHDEVANGVGDVNQEADTEDAVAADSVAAEPAPRLSSRETAEFLESVAGLTLSELPLSAGLRAAAEEVPQHRVAMAMRRMAADLDRGLSLDAALGQAGRNVPNHLRGLILAGLRTGRVAHVLEELVAMDQDRVDLRRRIVTALTYPTFLFSLLVVAFILANVFIVAPFAQIFDEFGVDLPTMTQMAISSMAWFDRSGLWTLIIAICIVLPAFVLLIVVPKPPDVQRACYRLPAIGPLWRWQSLVDFSRLMHLLLDRQVPMSEALRLTADGLRWSDLAAVSRACARDVDKGMGLIESMAQYPEFPASLQPVIASGVQAERPAEAFAAAADMYRSRAGVDVGLWEAILPPVIIVFVAVGVGFLVLAMFLPLIKLISCLT